MLAEAAIHVGAVYLAGTVRFLDIHFQVQSLAGEPLWLFPRALLYALVMLGTMTAFGLYGSELHKKDREYQVRFLASFPAVAVVLAFVYYAVPESTLARGIMALSLVFSLIFSASARALFFRIVGHDALKRRVLVIGSGSRAAEVEALLTRLGPSAGFNLVGFVQCGDGEPYPYQAKLFDKSPQRFVLAEQFGCVWVRLPIPTLYEAHEIGARARTEPGQQGLDFGRAGSAPDYKHAALQRVVTDDPEEQRTRRRREDQ